MESESLLVCVLCAPNGAGEFKQFKTPAALAQHTKDKHGSADFGVVDEDSGVLLEEDSFSSSKPTQVESDASRASGNPKKIWRYTPSPVIVGINQKRRRAFIEDAGYLNKVEQYVSLNPHWKAADDRFNLGNQCLRLLEKELTRNETNKVENALDLIVIWPRNSEVSFYKAGLHYLWKKEADKPANKKQAKVGTWRPDFHPTDWARGRVLGDCSLHDSNVIVSNDGLAYHLSPEELLNYIWDHPAIEQGVTIFVSGRYFKPAKAGETKIWLEEFRHGMMVVDDTVIKETIPYSKRQQLVNDQGEPQFGPEFKDPKTGEMKRLALWVAEHTERVIKGFIAEPDRRIEGWGFARLVDDLPGVEWHASMSKAGDSVYIHPLKGSDWFENEEITFKGPNGVFIVSMHQETSSGNFSVIKAVFRKTSSIKCDTEVVKKGISRTESMVVVSNGVMPSLADLFTKEVIRSNQEDPSSVKNLELKQHEEVIRMFGTLWSDMDQKMFVYKREPWGLVYQPTTLQKALLAAGETTMTAIRKSSRDQVLVGSGDRYREAAKANIELRVSDEFGIFAGVFAELSVKQTKLELLANLARRFVKWIQTIWRGLFGKESSLSVPKALAKLIATVSGRIGAFQGLVGSIQRFCLSHPEAVFAAAIFESIVNVFVVPTVEELLKRVTPVGVSFLMGAVEGILVGMSDSIDRNLGLRDAFVNTFTSGVLRSLAHGILTLMPIWLAIPVHTLWNLVDEIRRWQWTYPQWKNSFGYLEGELARLASTRPLDFSATSGLYVKGLAGEKRPVEVVDTEVESRKFLCLQNAVTDMLVCSNGTLPDICVVADNRLQADLLEAARDLGFTYPEHDDMEMAWSQADAITLLALEDFYCVEGKAVLMTLAETEEYISTRPWPQTLKKQAVTDMLAYEENQCQEHQKVIHAKVEVLKVKWDISQDDMLAARTRPIFPKTGVDTPLMKIIPVMKDVMSGIVYVTQGWDGAATSVGFFADYDTAVKHSISSKVASFSFRPTDTPADKTAWIRARLREPGWHANQYGDDHLSLCVFSDGSYREFAVDFKWCDKTCGAMYTRSLIRFVNTMFGHEPEVNALLGVMHSRLTGEFEFKYKMGELDERVFFDKADLCTNTGEFMTAMKALYAGFSSVLPAQVKWTKSYGPLDMGSFRSAADLLERSMVDLGFLPEFEKSHDGDILGAPGTRTFLGGRFCPTVNGPIYYSASFIKKCFIFPDTQLIYGGTHHVVDHMCVLLTDPELQTTPDGRVLLRYFERVVSQELGGSEWGSLAEKYEKWLMSTGSGRYELEERKQDGKNKSIDALSWAVHVEDVLQDVYGEGHGFSLPCHFQAELESINGGHGHHLTHGFYLGVLRFGKMDERKPRLQTNLLSLPNAFFNLGKIIFTRFYQNNMKSNNNTKVNHTKAKDALLAQSHRKSEALASELAVLQRKYAKAVKQGNTAKSDKINARTNETLGRYTKPKKEVVNKQAGFVAGKPMFGWSTDGSLTVSHREYISDVIVKNDDPNPLSIGSLQWDSVPKLDPFAARSTGDVAVGGRINPYNQDLFDSLAPIAECFEMFTIRKLDFEYKNRSSSAESGEVILAWDADVSDAPPSGKYQMLQMSHSVAASPHVDFRLSLPSSKKLYMETYQLTGGSASIAPQAVKETRLTYHGALYLATNGLKFVEGEAYKYIGDLFCVYSVTFHIWQPKPERQIAAGTFFRPPSWSGSTNYKPLGDTVARGIYNRGVDVGTFNSNVAGTVVDAVVFEQPGDYVVTLDAAGTGMSSVFTSHTGTSDGNQVVGASILNIIDYVVSATRVTRSVLFRATQVPAALAFWYNVGATITDFGIRVGKMMPGAGFLQSYADTVDSALAIGWTTRCRELGPDGKVMPLLPQREEEKTQSATFTIIRK